MANQDVYGYGKNIVNEVIKIKNKWWIRYGAHTPIGIIGSYVAFVCLSTVIDRLRKNSIPIP